MYKRIFDQNFRFIKMKMKKSNVKKVFTVSPEVKNIKDSLNKVYIVAETRPEFKFLYSKLKRIYDLVTSTEKKAYHRNIIKNAQNEPKETWKIVNSLPCNQRDNANGFMNNE
ncbi:hypothetical protein HHI36_014609 [Cryptolaemus montrouzieri]|uniref:Uncharacterized protein n=1 Tax=Cryptolaemus montrouzieri TaxID=559131 RepID=A0ABD2N414_9CUCU